MKWWWVLLCGLTWAAQAETFDALVVAVIDGDTVLVMRDRQKLKVRLANIDAPEKSQPFGKQSRDALRTLVHGQTVRIDSHATDQYARIIGSLYRDGINVNQEQVRRGMAWEYSHFHADKTYLALQNEAQQARRGLWEQAAPQPPWLWRREHPASERRQNKQ